MSIGTRLKEERERLGLSQAALGAIGDFGKTTVIAWERGTAFPNALFLSDIAEIGADIQYIVTGVRQGGGIGEAAVHQAVLDAVDLLSLEKKVDAQQLAKAVAKLCVKAAPTKQAPPDSPTPQFEGSMQVFHQAQHGDIAGRDIVKTGKARKG